MFKVEIGYEIYERGCVDRPLFKVESLEEFHFFTTKPTEGIPYQAVTHAVFAMYRDCLGMRELEEYMDDYDEEIWHVRVLLMPVGAPAEQYTVLDSYSGWLDVDLMRELIEENAVPLI